MRKLPEVLNEKEFKDLIKATHKEHHKLAFMLSYFCGLRVSEVIKLKPGDVDQGRGMLFIRQAKGQKDRYVPYPKKLAYRFKYLPINCSVRALQIAFKCALNRANIKKDLHYHNLRHTCATILLKKGLNLRQVQVLLGHSNISTTQIYTIVNPTELKEGYDKIWKS